MTVAAIDPHADPLNDLSAREMLSIIDEDIQRLPHRQRLAVILCCLEGRSLEEAARQLGWTHGSVKGRLERGRSRLHDQLVRRGLTLSGALAAVALSQNSSSPAATNALLIATVRAALGRAAAVGEVSSEATLLAGQTLRDMSLNRFKFGIALLLAVSLLAGGIVWSGATSVPTQPTMRGEMTPSTDSRLAAVVDEARIPIDVRGQVVDPQGKPVSGARLYVGFSAHIRVPEVRPQASYYPSRMTTATDGRFHFVFTKADLVVSRLDHSRPAVIAVADGYGPA
jgi:hypothetical protein